MRNQATDLSILIINQSSFACWEMKLPRRRKSKYLRKGNINEEILLRKNQYILYSASIMLLSIMAGAAAALLFSQKASGKTFFLLLPLLLHNATPFHLLLDVSNTSQAGKGRRKKNIKAMRTMSEAKRD
jgi:hypothetical protein